MKRGSPNPKLAHSVQRGKMVPCFHWPAASSHDAIWNATSCPEAVPSRKNGVSTANDTHTESIIAIPHSRLRCLQGLVETGRGDSLIGCCCDCNRKAIRSATLSWRLNDRKVASSICGARATGKSIAPHDDRRVQRSAEKSRSAPQLRVHAPRYMGSANPPRTVLRWSRSPLRSLDQRPPARRLSA